jgi:hypothetical protein
VNDAPGWERSQHWVARGVLACGVITGTSFVYACAIIDPQARFFANWPDVALVVTPFVLAAIAIRNGCHDVRVVWVTRLVATPVVLVGIAFTNHCFEIIEALLQNREWKWYFGPEWILAFMFIAYPFAFATARAAYGPPPQPGRGLFLRLGETSHDMPSER